MAIIIGRDQQSRRLSIVEGSQTKLYGQPGSVPMDVSRHHISLDDIGDGKWKLKNINAKNVTFVNDIAVETKTVSETDKVELGNSHYLLNWSALSKPKVETVDIRPLKILWETYIQTKDQIVIRKQKLQLKKQKQKILQGLTGVFIPSAIVLSIFCGGRDNLLLVCLYCMPAVITLIMTFFQYNGIKKEEDEVDKDKEEERVRELNFRRDYSCPNPKCKMYFSMPYDVLERYPACPYCKTKFKK